MDKKQPVLEYALDNPPQWAEHQIWYQIFVERFDNGDSGNDPRPNEIIGAWPYEVPKNWAISNWKSNWYNREDWQGEHNRNFYGDSQLRRYGGDLQGVRNRIDYLVDLGITAIYFNPMNTAPSLHKYDASYYHHIDPTFGPNPDEDWKIIAQENPNDPETWQWTSADQLFLELVQELHDKGIRVIVDYSWNHTGVEFWAWKDILKNQQNSPYADWYMIKQFDNPETEENEFSYDGWLGYSSLPELKKVHVGHREHGMPYEGDIAEPVKKHIFDVTQRWLAPNGEISKGVDGFRLDVADQIPMGFWKDYRQFVKSINPEAYLVGEIWWKAFPDQLMDPRPYLGRAAFDGIMYYQVFKPARGFFGENENHMDANQFAQELKAQWDGIDPKFLRSMMGLSTSHDTPRLLTSFANQTIYKQYAKPDGNPNYFAGKPGESAQTRAKLYLVHQFTSISSPHIWNGEEMGMWGADDPDCRKPLWWPEMNFEVESSNPYSELKESYPVHFDEQHYQLYKDLIQLRKNNACLQYGSLDFLITNGSQLVYQREFEGQKVYVLFNLGPDNLIFNSQEKLGSLKIVVGEVSSDDIYLSEIRLKPMTACVVEASNFSQHE